MDPGPGTNQELKPNETSPNVAYMTVLHCATRCEGWTPCSVGLSVTNEFPDLQLPLALDVNGGAALHQLARKTKSPSSTRSLTLRIVAPLTTPLDPTRSHNARARREARDAACGAALLGGCRSQEVHLPKPLWPAFIV